MEFLETDLKKASDPEQRSAVPWIVAISHRPMHHVQGYSMGSWNREGFAALFSKYRVSLFLCGHCLDYERTYPLSSDGVVTDWSSGLPEDPYVHSIWESPEVTKASEEQGSSHYCSWDGCRGGKQGDVWCNAVEKNCVICGGAWCPYKRVPKPEAAKGRWGTIQLIAGVGGRRGTRCPAMVGGSLETLN